ncbi:MAG: extracellular solute-binding protein, partial [Clostridia bacterium]|nr:extracellular solute-binding protein [Clostridia bacterium]
MKKKTLLSLVLLIAVISLVITGCGSNANNGGKTNEEANIKFLDVMPSEERTALLKGILDEFEDANSSIKVEYASVPWDEAYKKIVVMGSSDTLPDVFTGDVGIMLVMAQPGYAEKLTDKWNNWPYEDDLTAAATAASNMYTYNDDIYLIPDGFLLQGIFVRTDWLEELSIDVDSLQDWTWDEYHD